MRGKLPPLQPGKEWAFKIYPGGRAELQQVSTELIQSNEDGLAGLQNGHVVFVKMMGLSLELAEFISHKGTRP